MFPGAQYHATHGKPNQQQQQGGSYPPPPPSGGAYPPPPGGAYPPPPGGSYPPPPGGGAYPPPPGGSYPPPPGGSYPPPPGGSYPPPPGGSYPPPPGGSYPPPPGGGMNPPPPGGGAYPPPPGGAYPPPPGGSYPPPPSSGGAYPPPPAQSSGGAYPPPNNMPPNHYPPPGAPPGTPPGGNYPGRHGSGAPHAGYNQQQAGYSQQQAGYGQQQAGYGQQQVQLSNCTGRRRALLIGINYIGMQGELRGCINDVKNVRQFLIHQYKFRECDMVVLTDDQTDPRHRPTRANIISGMRWLVSDAQPNDSYFLHFSGHGGQLKDQDGDEDDGFDETILPLDYSSAGQIRDDDINALVVRPLPPGCRLTAIFDSCHSGTAMDLPYLYDERGQLVKQKISKTVTQSIQNAGKQYLAGNVLGAVSALKTGFQSSTGSKKASKITKDTRSSMGDVIMFSGCADSQTSADTHVQGFGATGAMSHAFIKAMTDNPQQTYTMLLSNLRGILRGKYSQKPQMSTGRPMDMNTWFIM